MSDSSIQFHKIWIDQCEATEGIRERFGLDDALHYLIGEKLFSFVHAAEDDPDFAAELPAFVAEIRRIFSPPRSVTSSINWSAQSSLLRQSQNRTSMISTTIPTKNHGWRILSWPPKSYFDSLAFANFCRSSAHGEIQKRSRSRESESPTR